MPLNKLLLSSVQMMLSCFVATVLIANICGVDVGAGLVGAGLATLTYVLFTGAKSPMFISNSGNFVAAVMMALSVAGYIGVLIGGLTTCLIYVAFGILFSKISVSNIYKAFPPALIGAVTMVIGINLMGFIPTYIGETGQWGTILALITAITIAILSHYAKGIVKILPFLIGILISYLLAAILTIVENVQLIDFSIFKNVELIQMPNFAFMNLSLDFDFMTIISIVVIYIAYSISQICECLSDHAALGGIIGVDLYKTPGLNKIFIGEGCANLVSSFVGGLGATSYGEGIACVGFSKVASIWVTITSAIMLGALGFIGPIQAFIASIPNCIFAGAAIILYGFIACSGAKMLQKVDLNNNKNLVIVSSTLSLGVGGLVLGGTTLSLTGTALALVMGMVMNVILKEK